jgi:GTP-binding nuclear protein Ran
MTTRNPLYEIKVLILGDAGVGKSTYVNRVVTGDFKHVYDETIDVVTSQTKYDDKDYTLVECPTDKVTNEILRDCDRVIVMFDHRPRTYAVAVRLYTQAKSVQNTNSQPKIFLMANKCDIPYRLPSRNLAPVRLSSKSNYNLYHPLD